MEISKDLLVSHFGCCLILGVSTCTAVECKVVEKVRATNEYKADIVSKSMH